MHNLGRGALTQHTAAEILLYRIDSVGDVHTCDRARVKLFSVYLKNHQTFIAPTSVNLHIKREHYQKFVWVQADTHTQLQK